MSQAFENHNLCKVTLLGNLVAKPEIRYLANPVLAVAEVVIATHSRWFDQNSQSHREWTDFHTIKVIGDIVEQTLRFAEKGAVMLVHGYLLNSKSQQREIIHASFAQVFNKGYANSINLVQCSGKIASDINLVQTPNDKLFAQTDIEITHQVVSPLHHKVYTYQLVRPVHIWGKQASYIQEHASVGDQLIIEGKLNYLKNQSKSQFVDARQSVLIKAPPVT